MPAQTVEEATNPFQPRISTVNTPLSPAEAKSLKEKFAESNVGDLKKFAESIETVETVMANEGPEHTMAALVNVIGEMKRTQEQNHDRGEN